MTGADIVYCDSWMSYGIAATERQERFKALSPFQIDAGWAGCVGVGVGVRVWVCGVCVKERQTVCERV